MSTKLIYLLLAVSIGINVGVIATTVVNQTTQRPQGPPPGPGGGGGPDQGPPPDPARLVEGHLQGITRHLDLDPDQQAAVRAVMEHHAPRLVRLQKEVAVTSRRLTAAYAAPEFTPDAFRALAVAATTARARLDSLSAELLVAEAAVLTDAQRRKFAEVAPSLHSGPQRRPEGNRPPPR